MMQRPWVQLHLVALEELHQVERPTHQVPLVQTGLHLEAAELVVLVETRLPEQMLSHLEALAVLQLLPQQAPLGMLVACRVLAAVAQLPTSQARSTMAKAAAAAAAADIQRLLPQWPHRQPEPC
jgi:hypothetical protein